MNNPIVWVGFLVWAIVFCAAFVNTEKLNEMEEKEEMKLRLQHHGRADLLDDREYAAKGYSEIPDREGEDEE